MIQMQSEVTSLVAANVDLVASFDWLERRICPEKYSIINRLYHQYRKKKKCPQYLKGLHTKQALLTMPGGGGGNEH